MGGRGSQIVQSLCHSGLLWDHVAKRQEEKPRSRSEQRTRPRIHSHAAAFAEVGFAEATHSIPMVGMPALRAASASYGVSPIATASGPLMPSFVSAT